MLIFLLACDTTPGIPPVSCDELVAPPVVACFGGDGLDYPGYGPLAAEVEGTVVTVGTGPLPDTCTVEVGNALEDVDDAVFVEVEDATGARVTAAWRIPGLSVAPVAVGDAVSLDLSYVFGEFGPDVGHVVLDGWALGVTEAGALDDLALPDGVTFSEGEQRCHEVGDCGDWAKYDIDAAVDGATTTVPYGDAASVGAYQVTHGGYERQDEGQGGLCPDWFVAHVSVGFTSAR